MQRNVDRRTDDEIRRLVSWPVSRRFVLERLLGLSLMALGSRFITACGPSTARRLGRFRKISELLLERSNLLPDTVALHLQVVDAKFTRRDVDRQLRGVDRIKTAAELVAFRGAHPALCKAILLSWYTGLSDVSAGITDPATRSALYLSGLVWTTVRPCPIGVPYGQGWDTPV